MQFHILLDVSTIIDHAALPFANKSEIKWVLLFIFYQLKLLGLYGITLAHDDNCD